MGKFLKNLFLAALVYECATLESRIIAMDIRLERLNREVKELKDAGGV